MTKFLFSETETILITDLGVDGDIGGTGGFSPWLSHGADHFEGNNLHTFEYLNGANAILTVDIVLGSVTKVPVAYTLPRPDAFAQRHVPYIHELGVWIGNAGGGGGIDLIRDSDGVILDSYGTSSTFSGYNYDLTTLNSGGLAVNLKTVEDGHVLVYYGALKGGCHIIPFDATQIFEPNIFVYNNEWLTWGVTGINAASEKETMHLVKTSDQSIVGFALSEDSPAVALPSTIRLLNIDLAGSALFFTNESEIELAAHPLLINAGFGGGSPDVHSIQCHELTGPDVMFLALEKNGDLFVCKIQLVGDVWDIVDVEVQSGFRPAADPNFSCGLSTPIPARFPLCYGENNAAGQFMLFDPTALDNKRLYTDSPLSLFDWIVPYTPAGDATYYLAAAQNTHELQIIGFGGDGSSGIQFFPEFFVDGNFGIELIIPSHLSNKLRKDDYTGVLNQLVDQLGALLPTLADKNQAACYLGLDANNTPVTNVADGTLPDDLVNFGQVKAHLGIV